MAADKTKNVPRVIPVGKTQVNFNIDDAILGKVKAISFAEGVNNSELYNLAVKKFVEVYESKNGKVQLPKSRGDGLKRL